MKEVIVKMPRKSNKFSGRCTLSPPQFSDLQALVGIGKLVIVHQDEDGEVRGASSRDIQQWMVDSAKLMSGERGDFYLVIYSKNVYLRVKGFKNKHRYMTDQEFQERLAQLEMEAARGSV